MYLATSDNPNYLGPAPLPRSRPDLPLPRPQRRQPRVPAAPRRRPARARRRRRSRVRARAPRPRTVRAPDPPAPCATLCPTMVCTVPTQLAARARRACLLAACLLENPAYKSTGDLGLRHLDRRRPELDRRSRLSRRTASPRLVPRRRRGHHGAKNTEPVLACEPPEGSSSQRRLQGRRPQRQPRRRGDLQRTRRQLRRPRRRPAVRRVQDRDDRQPRLLDLPAPQGRARDPVVRGPPPAAPPSATATPSTSSASTPTPSTSPSPIAVQDYLKKDKDGLHRVWIGLEAQRARTRLRPAAQQGHRLALVRRLRRRTTTSWIPGSRPTPPTAPAAHRCARENCGELRSTSPTRSPAGTTSPATPNSSAGSSARPARPRPVPRHLTRVHPADRSPAARDRSPRRARPRRPASRTLST
jgi:hypothetical protein